MSFKDTLLVLTSYPEPTPRESIDQALALGTALETRMTAISFEIDVQVPGGRNFLADMLLDLPSMVAAEREKAAVNAKGLLDAFEAEATPRGLFQARLKERALTPLIPDVLTEQARLHDLTIIPLREGDSVEHVYAESIIFGSGRPCIVLPGHASAPKPPALTSIAIAWDFSRPAARALADAMPILQKAKAVRCVTVAEDKTLKSTRSHEQLANHLRMHGVEAAFDTVEAAGREIGDILHDYVVERNIDLLVMGAYGHSRVRDFVIGGATKTMLRKPPVPLFLSH